MFLAGKQEHNMKARGTKATVPNYDVCKLSYFMMCGTVGCGIDIIVDELVEYSKAHLLPEARQDSIFKLAYADFDDDALVGKTNFPR